MTDLGPDWIPDGEGIPHRQAARVLLFDSRGRLLLIQGHDDHRRDRHWWFTVGGGIEPGESIEDAAVREVREETGIQLDPAELIGPVLLRYVTLDFENVLARQDEFFFIAHTNRTKIVTSGWTPQEQSVLDGARWWPIDELARCSGIDEGGASFSAASMEVYPRNLVTYVHRWRHGWDGTLLEVRDQDS